MDSLYITEGSGLKNEALCDARMQLGLKESEVAEAVGVSCGYISRLERMSSYPGEEVAEKICDFFGRCGIEASEEHLFPGWLKVVAQSDESVDVPVRLPDSAYASHCTETFILPSPDDALVAEESLKVLSEKLDQLVGRLLPRHGLALTMRYGLDDGFPKTYGETAEALDVTISRARFIYERALARLRLLSPEKLLDEFMNC